MRFFVTLILCLIMTSCGFSHLTEVQNLDSHGLTAKECGSCHVEQYAEWKQTVHVHGQAMHGPHESGALFSPHAIAQNSVVNSRVDSSQLCGVCHEETYEQWQSQRVSKEYPTCRGCHGGPVERPTPKELISFRICWSPLNQFTGCVVIVSFSLINRGRG